MTLTGKQILVKPLTPVGKTTSGLFLPESAQKERNRGTITHVGIDVDKEKYLNKEVLFHIQAAQNFEYEDISGKLIFETDVIAFV